MEQNNFNEPRNVEINEATDYSDVEDECRGSDLSDIDIEDELNDMNNGTKLSDEQLQKSINQLFGNSNEVHLKEKSTAELPKCFFIMELNAKPEYTFEAVWERFPRGALNELIKIYKVKANAGKLFDRIIIEVLTSSNKKIGNQNHKSVWKFGNVWIPISRLTSYRNNRRKRLEDLVYLIAKEMDGKLHYRFVKKDKKDFLVVDVDKSLIFKDGKATYVNPLPYDYKLNAAELVYLRMLQCTISKNGYQLLTKAKLMKFGEIAWHYQNNKIKQHQNAIRFLMKLYLDRRVWIDEKRDDLKENYFIFVVNPKERRYRKNAEVLRFYGAETIPLFASTVLKKNEEYNQIEDDLLLERQCV